MSRRLESDGPGDGARGKRAGEGGVRWPRGAVLRVCRLLLRYASGSVPVVRRREWLEEWEGELWTLGERGATRGALLRFGLDSIGEARWERREEEGAMGGIAGDVRYAWRRLSRRPGYALVIVLVLGLGIGANTALFGALRAALLDAPPYPEAERIVTVDLLLAQRSELAPDTMPWSWPKFVHVREAMRSVESLAGWTAQTNTVTGDGFAVRVGVEYVTPGYFELLGVRARAGRLFGSAEEEPGPAAVAALSHAFWQSRYGSDPSVLGRMLTLNGVQLEIIGIVPEGFAGVSGGADLWVPVAGITAIQGPRRLQLAWAHWLRVLGRLADGVTLEQARAEGELLGAGLTEAYPDPSGGGEHGVTMVPFLAARVNPVARLSVAAVSVAALLLLLIACGNVAGLMLARASANRGDVVVRAALGAGRARLVRESLVESLMLASAGGALGLVLAFAGRDAVALAAGSALDLTGTRGIQFMSQDAIRVDVVVLAGGILVALLTGLLTGLLPARHVSRLDLGGDLRGGRATVGGIVGRDAGRSALVAGQLALTLMLLAGAGLMAASLARLSAVDVGFTNDGVLAVAYDRGPGDTADQLRAFEATLLERAAALPGVHAAAISPCAPLAGRCEIVGLRQVDDQPPIDYGDMDVGLVAYAVSDAYFATLGIPLRAGRTFDGADGPGAPAVAVINEAAAAELFGDASVIGHRIGVTHDLTPEDGPLAEIVGIVADVPYGSLEEGVMPAIYFSRGQAPVAYGTLLLATSGDPYALVGATRELAARIESDMPLFRITTLGDLKKRATARTRVVLALLATFGATGLLMSAVGLYGIVSYSVVRRTREMGLRLALGAASRDVARLVLKAPALLALAGVVAGMAGAALLTRYLEALLFGVDASDPRILAAAATLLVGVALAAAWVPARLALRVDPASALRED
jgi:predicted permease